MSVDQERMLKVRRTVCVYGGSAYLRSNFFGDIPERTWNAKVEPLVKSFKADPNFVGYYPAVPLAPSFEKSLSVLANLIIRLQDEKA